MSEPVPDHDPLLLHLQKLIDEQFRTGAGPMTADEPLLGGKTGLDSLDAIELGLSVEEEFGVTIASAAESRTAFSSLASLAAFIRQRAARRDLSNPGRLSGFAP